MIPDPLVTGPEAYAIRLPVLSKTRKLTMSGPGMLFVELLVPLTNMIQKWQGAVIVPKIPTDWAMHCPDRYAVGFVVPVDVT